MKTVKLKNGLICVSVPMDAQDINCSYSDTTSKTTVYYFDPKKSEMPYFFKNIENNYQILGTITKDECSFDCSEYVESWSKNYGELHFKDCKDENRFFINSIGGFKSMIEAETEFLFENPKPNINNFDFRDKIHNDKILKEWNQAQSRVIEKLLILKTI